MSESNDRIRRPPWRRWGGVALPLAAFAALLVAMPGVARRTFSSDEFMPHGHCYLWQPEMVWLHATSDTLIALAYFSIPVALVFLAARRRDLPFSGVFLLFGAFVFACGATHVMDVWTLWIPTYWLAGGLKAITAAISIASAIVLVRTLPHALRLPDRLKEITAINAELRASEERFRHVLESAPVGMVLVDEAGLVVLVNETLERMFGYAREEILGRPVETLIPESARSEHPRHRASILHDGRARSMGAGRDLYGLRKDGVEIPIEVGLMPLVELGAPHVLGSVVDISDRRKAERARLETARALQSFQIMVERVKDYAIFQLDAEGRILTWNSGARAIKGYEAHEVIGKNISIFYPPETSARAAEELRIAAATGHHEDESWRVRKDGSRFWASVVLTAVPGPTPGSVAGFLKVTRDLTERKRAEDLQSNALRERTALLQEVHHRVKNNLQMVASLLNIQARQVADPQARALFLETRGRVHSIALLHESLYQSDDLGRVDTREYVARLVAALEQTLRKDGPSPRIVQRIDQVLFPIDLAVPCGLLIHELVVNALKHAFTGGSTSDEELVQLTLTERSDSFALIVADNGRGLATIPDPEDESTMGLALVHALTSQLQGSVTFENDGGARCTVVFPKQGPSMRSAAPAEKS